MAPRPPAPTGKRTSGKAAQPQRSAALGLPTIVILEDGAPPLPRVPAALARRFQQVCATMVAEAISGEEIVQLEYASLVALELEPGVDQRRLADAVGIDPSNAGHIVDRLQSMRLIERRINSSDRRARELYVTSKGAALWRRVRARSSVANAKILAPLAPHERELFLDLLVRVIQGNWGHARPGAGRRKRSAGISSSRKT
jgi:DNA-binding MarR family transcriptional regulator